MNSEGLVISILSTTNRNGAPVRGPIQCPKCRKLIWPGQEVATINGWRGCPECVPERTA